MLARPVGSLTARPAHRAGLSLLEVLLSLAIFLMAIAAIGALVDFGQERGMAAGMQTTGTRLAQSKLAEVEAGAIPVSSASSGQFDDEPEWSWSVEPGGTAVPNVYPVTVTVWRTYKGQRYEVSLTQMVLDPTVMGPATPAPPPTATTSTSTSGTTSSTTTATTSTGGTGR